MWHSLQYWLILFSHVFIQSFLFNRPGISRFSENVITSATMGVDFGTSGVRICVVDESGTVVEMEDMKYSEYCSASYQNVLRQQSHLDWIAILHHVLDKIPPKSMKFVDAISVCGTSATVILFDTSICRVSRGPLMYDFSVLNSEAMSLLKRYTTSSSNAACSSTSALAKLLHWHLETPLSPYEVLGKFIQINRSHL